MSKDSGTGQTAVDGARKLSWNEPGVYKRAKFRIARRGKPFDPVPWVIALGISAAMIGSAVYRNKPFLADSWPATVAVSLVGPAAFLVLIARVSMLGGDVVILSAKGINRNGPQGGTMVLRYWRWDSVASCELGTVEVDGQTFEALTAHFHDGTQESFALSPKVTTEAVETAVRGNGVAVRRGAMTP